MKTKPIDFLSLWNAFYGMLIVAACLFLSYTIAETLSLTAWIVFLLVLPSVVIFSYILQVKRFSREETYLKNLTKQNEIILAQKRYIDGFEASVEEYKDVLNKKQELIDKLSKENTDLLTICQELRDNAQLAARNEQDILNQSELAMKRTEEKLKEANKLLSQAQERIQELVQVETERNWLKSKTDALQKELEKADKFKILWADEPTDQTDLIEFLELQRGIARAITNSVNPRLGRIKKENID